MANMNSALADDELGVDGFVLVDRCFQCGVPHTAEKNAAASSDPTTKETRNIQQITLKDVWELSVPLYLEDINTYIRKNVADALWLVNKKIHDNPEKGYREVIAHEALTSFFEARATSEGWVVTRSAYGLETAWIAVYDSGREGPVVSFNVEMDALPSIGHACGHNLIASASVAAGLATAEIMRKHELGGKVVLFGTPAEEGGGGKIKLLDRGAYKDHEVDVSLISHPGTVRDAALVRTTAYTRFRVEYFGREAHAAAEPWKGINALDALITAYNALSVLRQQTMPGDLIQGHITDGGLRPNIVHAYAAGIFVARATTQERLVELRRKVDACFEAGATASGAKLKVTQLGAYKDHIPNRVLGRSYTSYFNCLLDQEGSKEEEDSGGLPQRIPVDQDVDEFLHGASMASSDQGDISHAMPSLMPGFEIAAGPGGAGPHNPGFAESAGTREAYNRSLRVGKALAGTAIDILTHDGLLKEVKDEFKRRVGE